MIIYVNDMPMYAQLKGLNEAQKQHLQELKKIIDKDPLTVLCEQDKDLVWRLRYECNYHYPESLPKLLNCVKWNNHKDVAKVGGLCFLFSGFLVWSMWLRRWF